MKLASRTYRQYPLQLAFCLLCALVLFIGLFAFAGRRAKQLTQRAKPILSPSALSAGDAPHGRDARATSYGRMELAFEPNRGQTDETVNFLARGADYAMFLRAAEAVLVMSPQRPPASLYSTFTDPEPEKILRLELSGANASAQVDGLDPLPGTVNYFIGNSPARWQTNTPTFRRVRYRDIYPGVDLVYYGNQRQLEYDFVLAPGRDPQLIRLQFAGAEKPNVDAAGHLSLTVGTANVQQPKAVIYQEINGVRHLVEGGYSVQTDGLVGFTVGEYDKQYPLIIDPTLVYSTYFGGSGSDDARDIAVDSAGNAYFCGSTNSVNFPVVNALQPVLGGSFLRDIFVTKINAAGTAILYSTYLGGSGNDTCDKLALDSAGNAYINGETTSTNFPIANAFQSAYGGGSSDAVVTKLNSSGSALFYSTYLGGVFFDQGGGIAVDANGAAYVAGRTNSSNFPTFNALQPSLSGGSGSAADAFVTKFSSSGSSVLYSTFLGGSNFDAALGIAVDSAGSAYVVGQTTSTNFPLANPIQSALASSSADDAFISKFTPNGTALVYSTYLGGAGGDVAVDIALDAGNNAYLTGVTSSLNFPLVNAFQSVYGGNGDAFVTKLNSAGTAISYSTYLGGGGNEAGNAIAVDSSAHAYVAGATASIDFPVFNASQGTFGGVADAFLTKLTVAGTGLIYSTYLGGSNSEGANGVAVDLSNNAYLTGSTISVDFPVVNPLQAAKDAEADAFVAKISDPQPTVVQFSSATYSAAEEASFLTLTLNRLGDLTGQTTVDFSTADGTASQRGDYTLGSGTVSFAVGETSKTFRLLISEDAYVEGNENFTISLVNPLGGGVGTPAAATVTIIDDDATNPPVVNPIDDANIFVRQHYHDFLAREGDSAGIAFWTNTITQCGSNQVCINNKRIDVSNAFFFEPEFQQTGVFVYRVYRESFGNNQPFPNPNPDPANPGEEKRVPLYLPFMRDRARVRGGAQLAQLQLDFATIFVQRPEFVAKYPLTLDGPGFVDAVLATLSNDIGVNLSGQRQALIDLYNQGSNTSAARANVIYRLADDNTQTNPINNRAFIDAEYNRAFVFTEYAGYLRRNADMPGFLFWLGQVNSAPLRDVAKQHAMVCAFITAAEYQQRFSSVLTHTNGECQ